MSETTEEILAIWETISTTTSLTSARLSIKSSHLQNSNDTKDIKTEKQVEVSNYLQDCCTVPTQLTKMKNFHFYIPSLPMSSAKSVTSQCHGMTTTSSLFSPSSLPLFLLASIQKTWKLSIIVPGILQP